MAKPWFLAVLPAALLLSPLAEAARCSSTVHEPGYKKSAPTIDAPELLVADGPLIAGGKVTCHVSYDLMSGNHNVMHRIETGVLDGIKYRFYYSDGSGLVQGLAENVLDVLKDKYSENWSLRCRKDEMNDTHYCSMTVSVRQSHLLDPGHKGDGVHLKIRGHHCPYRQDCHAPKNFLSQTI